MVARSYFGRRIEDLIRDHNKSRIELENNPEYLKWKDEGETPFQEGEYQKLVQAYRVGCGGLTEVGIIVPQLKLPARVSPVIHNSSETNRQYIRNDARKYAIGVHDLQQACIEEGNQNHPQFVRPDGSRIYRQQTVKEALRARIEHYKSYDSSDPKRLELFNKFVDSCCGVAYKGGTTKFKLVPECAELITIPRNFDKTHLSINYQTIGTDTNFVELDRSKGKYGQGLTKKEVLEHPAWLAVVEEDDALLKAYADIVFAEKGTDRAMWFWVLDRPNNDQLRALFVISIGDYSNAYGNLYVNGSFLRVAP